MRPDQRVVSALLDEQLDLADQWASLVTRRRALRLKFRELGRPAPVWCRSKEVV